MYIYFVITCSQKISTKNTDMEPTWNKIKIKIIVSFAGKTNSKFARFCPHNTPAVTLLRTVLYEYIVIKFRRFSKCSYQKKTSCCILFATDHDVFGQQKKKKTHSIQQQREE